MVRTTEEARELAAKRKNPGRKTRIAEETKAAVMDSVKPLPEVYAVLVELMNSRDPNVKLAAAQFWVEQRCGKAKQSVEATGAEGGPIEYVLTWADAGE